MNASTNQSKSNSPIKKYMFYVLFIVLFIIVIYVIYYAWNKSQQTNANEPIIISDIIDSNIDANGIYSQSQRYYLFIYMCIYLYAYKYLHVYIC